MQEIVLFGLFIIIILIIFGYKSAPKNYTKSIQNSNVGKPKVNKIAQPEENIPDDSSFGLYKNEWAKKEGFFILQEESVIDLFKQKKIDTIGYSDLLGCFEWKFLRFKILLRDNFGCQDCGEVDDMHHVHHKYYLKDLMPWEIDENALVTLCRSCHTKRHEFETIKIYKKVENKFISTSDYCIKCQRCNGTGYLPQYNHVEEGICFLCHGDIVNKTIFSTRLTEIKNNQSSYCIERMYDDFVDYIESISIDFYKDHVHNKFYGEMTSFFSTDYMAKFDSKVAKIKNKNRDANYEEEEDDYPF